MKERKKEIRRDEDASNKGRATYVKGPMSSRKMNGSIFWQLRRGKRINKIDLKRRTIHKYNAAQLAHTGRVK